MFNRFRLDLALQDRTRNVEQMNAIIDKAEVEKRGLTTKQRAELRDLEAEIKKLDWQIAESRAGRDPLANERNDEPNVWERGRRLAVAHGIASPREDEGVALTREQRMTEWYEQRHGNFGPAGDGIDAVDADACNVGALVRGLVTGNRSGLNDAERRALAEGVDAA